MPCPRCGSLNRGSQRGQKRSSKYKCKYKSRLQKVGCSIDVAFVLGNASKIEVRDSYWAIGYIRGLEQTRNDRRNGSIAAHTEELLMYNICRGNRNHTPRECAWLAYFFSTLSFFFSFFAFSFFRSRFFNPCIPFLHTSPYLPKNDTNSSC